jgi:hypothetical protein
MRLNSSDAARTALSAVVLSFANYTGPQNRKAPRSRRLVLYGWRYLTAILPSATIDFISTAGDNI